MKHRVLSLVAVAGMAWLVGGASCAGRTPLPKHLQVTGVPQLQARMDKARSRVQKYFAEARLTYFGPDGRIKGSANLAVERPNRLRYDIMGPHGGVIEAFATNGLELQLLSPGQSRFLHGPASTANIERLMSFAPLKLDAAGWVSMLFGEVTVPAHATLRYDEEIGRFTLAWTDGETNVGIEVDPETSRVTRARLMRDGVVLSDVAVQARDAAGLPSELRMNVPPSDIDVRVQLRDVEHDPSALEESAFSLDAPSGITPERL